MPGIHICEVTESRKISDNTFTVTVNCGALAAEARAGQFVHIKCGEALILRRPVSICTARGEACTFVFEVKGQGTRWLSEVIPGQALDILGPLGNGYDIPENGNILLVGGGIGVPPLLFAAETASAARSKERTGDHGETEASNSRVIAMLGFRSKERVILQEEFRGACDNVYPTTDDGSYGLHGTVDWPVEELLNSGWSGEVLACGPRVMLSAVARLCERYYVPCQVSLEERMGCGVGACLVCACATVHYGAERMSRVCRDGPVFDSREVIWD